MIVALGSLIEAEETNKNQFAETLLSGKVFSPENEKAIQKIANNKAAAHYFFDIKPSFTKNRSKKQAVIRLLA